MANRIIADIRSELVFDGGVEAGSHERWRQVGMGSIRNNGIVAY